MLLQIEDVHKSFDDQPILRGISASIAEGEIIALLGPSGCGKTTLLRIIAGLETADSGQLLLKGADLGQTAIHKRNFGMVFQDYALFPHKNVQQNVAFGLRMSGWDQPQLDDRVRQVLQLVGLAEFGERAVHELSGGEQQRVALARALAPFPQLLLLDEPLGSLDRTLRERLMGELRSILKEAGGATVQETAARGPDDLVVNEPAEEAPMLTKAAAMTSIYVTHDQEEAFAIADRVLVMNEGQIEQEGTPVELFRRPRTPFVTRFLGMENLLEVEITSQEPPVVDSALGALRLVEPSGNKGDRVMLLIRPEAASLVAEDDSGPNLVEGQLTDVSFRGRHQVATMSVTSGSEPVVLRLYFESTVVLPAVSSTIGVCLNPAGLQLLSQKVPAALE